jgi:hypothetical protein
MGLGRIGNFIDGQIVGAITTLPWGVQFPDADGIRHPVVLYDGLKYVLLGPYCDGCATTIRRQEQQPRFVFGMRSRVHHNRRIADSRKCRQVSVPAEALLTYQLQSDINLDVQDAVTIAPAITTTGSIGNLIKGFRDLHWPLIPIPGSRLSLFTPERASHRRASRW